MEKTRSRVFRFIKRAALALLVLTAALLAWVSVAGAIPSDRNADCIVIFGSAVRPNRTPSDALRYRLEAGLRLFQQGRAPRIIVTGGGQGDYLEADVMAEWLVNHGVPESAIVQEPASATTRENGINTARIMRENGWRTALVCTQWFHVARARVTLSQEGIETLAAPCGGSTLRREPRFVAKELAALPIYALRLDKLR